MFSKTRSTLDSLPLLLLLAVAVALLLEVLALLVGAHAAEQGVAFLALELVAREPALLGLLFVVDLADLGDLVVARRLDAAHGLWAEVRGRDQHVREAQELLEDGERVLVGR